VSGMTAEEAMDVVRDVRRVVSHATQKRLDPASVREHYITCALVCALVGGDVAVRNYLDRLCAEEVAEASLEPEGGST